jgi:hypothetical protein
MGQGAYHDHLVKFGGQSKIRHRRVVNDFLVSEPAKPVNLADPASQGWFSSPSTQPTTSIGAAQGSGEK